MVSGVVPNSGPLHGGYNLTISGVLLNEAASVIVAGVQATIVSQSSSTIVVVTGPSMTFSSGLVIVQSSLTGTASLSGVSFTYTPGM